MSAYGLTRARSAGGVAEAVERAGGSLARVYRRANLPLKLVEHPEQLILLRDQTRLLDAAAREIGDDALPARLSTEGGCLALGDYAQTVCAGPTLGAAIERANRLLDRMLQSSTRQTLDRIGGEAIWSYELTDRAVEGRQTNELLCLGYRLDMMRRYLGRGWAPIAVTLPGRMPDGRSANEQTLGCDFVAGDLMSVVFRADDLDAERATHFTCVAEFEEDPVPDSERLLELANALVALELLDRMPSLGDLARRLAQPARSLQRRLASAGASFAELREKVLKERAKALLRGPDLTVTEIALELGYADVAHFSRAFAHWTGEAPSAWRRRERGQTSRFENRPLRLSSP